MTTRDRAGYDRDAEAAGEIDRADAPAAAPPPSAVVVQTFAESTYPTAAASFFACRPVAVASAGAAEGAAASFSTFASDYVIYALNLGSEVPPIGSRHVASRVGAYWVFRYR